MSRRTVLTAIVVLAVLVAGRTFMYFDGSYEDGELVDGVAVGRLVSSCAPASEPCDVGPGGLVLCVADITDRCVSPTDRLIARVFPDGPPSPVVRVTANQEPPMFFPWQQPPTYLGGHSLTVITLADGIRRVGQTCCVGEAMELRDPAAVAAP
jgi:hypothetical protein